MDNPLIDVVMSSVITLELTGTGGTSSSSATACCLCNFSLLPESFSVTLSLTSLMTTDGDVRTSLVSIITLSSVSLAMPDTFSLVVLDGIIPMTTSDDDNDEATSLGVVVVKVTSAGKVVSLPV